MNIPDWNLITPEAMRTYPEADLHFIMKQNQGGVYDAWAGAELQRRRDEALTEVVHSLREATHQVHQEVAILNSSSDRMERHTITLKNFTIALIVFAVIQIAIAGAQTWKMFQDSLSPQPAPTGSVGNP
jgi:hypothetical protein